MENQVQEQTLKAGAIGRGEITLMAVAGAAPVMCIGGSMHTFLSQTGTGISLAAVFATLLCIFIGLSYGNLSEKYNNCGGTYSYITEIFGKKAGLWCMFVYYGVMLTTSACPPTIFATYLESMTGIPIIVGWLIFAAIMVALTWFGVELSTKALVVVFIAEMVMLIWPGIKLITLSATGFDFGVSLTNAFAPSAEHGMTGILLCTLTWIWSYVGFEAPSFMGEELKGGAKDVKFAIPVSALLTGIIYVVGCWLWTATLTPEQATELIPTGDALAAYANMLGYTAGATIVSIGVMLAALACGLAFYSMMPRFLYDQGRKGILPKVLTKLNKHQIPHVGMFIYLIISFCATMYGGYAYGGPEVFGGPLFDGINDWFVIMAICATTAYAFICLGNIKENAKDNSFKSIILNKIIPIICILVILYVIFFTTGTKFVVTTLVWYAAALILALIVGRKKGVENI